VEQTKQQNLTFTIDGNKIECESEVKLLGVTIDFQLNFNEHVSNICKKAPRQLNVLKRIGTHLTKLGKLTIYYSFIMPSIVKVKFCCLVCLLMAITWNFSGLAFILLMENQLIKVTLSSSKVEITLFIS
jgi:hypothetical protein